MESGKSVQITDGMSDARRPVFDRDGQYLYFTASTNYAPTTSGLDMSSDEHDVTSSIYLAVLPNNIASPLAPESDEEGAPRPAAEGGRGGRGGNGGHGSGAPGDSSETGAHRFRQAPAAYRRAAISPARPIPGSMPDVPAFCSCWSRRAAVVAAAAAPGGGGAGSTLTRFDLKTRKSEKFADGVASFNLSANGEKVLLRMGVPGAAGGRGAPGAVASGSHLLHRCHGHTVEAGRGRPEACRVSK